MSNMIEFSTGYKVLKNFDEESEKWFGPFPTEEAAKAAVSELEDDDALAGEFQPEAYCIIDSDGLMHPFTTYPEETGYGK